MLKFLFILMFMASCTISEDRIITDSDGDGISDGTNFLTQFYKLRSEESLFTVLSGSNILDGSEVWYLGGSVIQFNRIGEWPNRRTVILKDGVQYEQALNEVGRPYYSKDSSRCLFEITKGSGMGKFVFLTVEPSPILGRDFFFLLVSKQQFATLELALTSMNSKDFIVPHLKIGAPMLELIFDPMGDFSPIYGNKNEQLQKIKELYTPIEFFGADTIESKKAKLIELDYLLF